MRPGSSEQTVLNFHGIGTPLRDLEAGEAPFWLGVAQFNAILDSLAARPDRQRFAITFDDSNISDLAIAVPALLERGLTARFFVLTGRMGARGSLSERDVEEIAATGMGIGSHGVAHNNLTTLSDTELARELSSSRARLEDLCQTPIETFSIPFGRYNRRSLAAIRQSGYEGAYTSDGGTARDTAFLRPRRSLRKDTSDVEVARLLSGHIAVNQRVRRALSMTIKQWR